MKYTHDKYKVYAGKTVIAQAFVSHDGSDEIRILQGMQRSETIKKIIQDCPNFAKGIIHENYYPYLF